MSWRPEIHYFGAPCGSGKTHRIADLVCELAAKGQNVIVLQPSKELIDKTVADELTGRKNKPVIHVIHGDTVPSVSSSIVRLSREKNLKGVVIFSTHQDITHLQYFKKRHNWTLIIDEDLQAERYCKHELPNTHELITRHLEIVPHDAIYGRVGVAGADDLKAMAKNSQRDEVFEVLSDTLRVITNSNWETFVNLASYAKLKEGKVKTLAFHSCLSPRVVEGFKKILMTSANFKESAIYQLWQDKVSFMEDTSFGAGLRYTQHPNGHLVTIYYGMGGSWSKKKGSRLLDPSSDNKETIRDRLISSVANLCPENEYIWHGNVALKNPPTGSNAIPLPSRPHGLNSFMHVHDVAIFSAVNPNPDHTNFLRSLGLDREAVRGFTYYSTAYQAILRSSLRNTDDQNEKRIFVADLYLAEYLARIIPGAKIEKMDIGIDLSRYTHRVGRSRKFDSGSQRQAVYRRRMKLIDGIAKVEAMLEKAKPENRYETTIESYSIFVTHLTTATLYRGKKTVERPIYFNVTDIDEYVDYLRASHDRVLSSKDDNGFISPAVFIPAKSKEFSRGNANITFVRHVYLDLEDGDLSPAEFPSLFPHLRMVLFNSFRHTRSKPRFRVFIPTTRPMTKEAYELIFDNIVAKLEDAGYHVIKSVKGYVPAGMKRSGLDHSKRSASSIFHLPCKSTDHKSEAFFIDHDGEDRDILDPSDWVKNSVVWEGVVPKKKSKTKAGSIDNALVDAAIAEWNDSRNHPGQGNPRFYILALALQRAGLSEFEIENTLVSEAANGRRPIKRRVQISSIMKSLENKYQFDNHSDEMPMLVVGQVSHGSNSANNSN